jgi:hypothetical protein
LNCLPESALSKKSEFLNIFISSPPCLLVATTPFKDPHTT